VLKRGKRRESTVITGKRLMNIAAAFTQKGILGSSEFFQGVRF
jgi:hypothetical protein